MNYFSKIDINPQRREARKLLANPRAMHASVMSLFPPTVSSHDRVLWRLDSAHPHHVLYIVSPEQPDFSHLNESVAWESAPGQSLDYTQFLCRVEVGTEWLFRVQANPTRALAQGAAKPGTRGKVIPLVKEDQQLKWLLERASAHGFEIMRRAPQGEPARDDPEPQGFPDVRITENTELRFGKREGDGIMRTVTLRKSVFEGRLVVTDELAFRRALLTGLGRAKSYGFGLLTLRK